MPTNAPLPSLAAPDLDRSLSPLLGPWMRGRRWFADMSARQVDATVVAMATLDAPESTVHGDAMVLAVLVEVDADGATSLYQVPVVLTCARAHAGAADEARIGEVEIEGRPIVVEDATLTDAGRAALWALVADRRDVTGDGLALVGTARPGVGEAPLRTSRVLSGEQSNTSMILELDGAAPVIIKLLRLLHAGDNPDVVLQEALDAAGCAHVAPFVGMVRATWTDGSGDALVAQEFLPGVEDAWRVALVDAERGRSFAEPARELGRAVARVHRALAESLGMREADPVARERAVAVMGRRLAEAAARVPEVGESRAALEGLQRAALDAPWPPLQRIHGDLHLGQVLAAPGRGWVLLDFEGEPMRPLAERTELDCPVRDVAGLLRSLDYVAGALALEKDIDASAWTATAREALVDGYREEAGIARDEAGFATLLAAFEADKAAYEALYEARNRPDWSPIPLGALAALTRGRD